MNKYAVLASAIGGAALLIAIAQDSVGPGSAPESNEGRLAECAETPVRTSGPIGREGAIREVVLAAALSPSVPLGVSASEARAGSDDSPEVVRRAARLTGLAESELGRIMDTSAELSELRKVLDDHAGPVNRLYLDRGKVAEAIKQARIAKGLYLEEDLWEDPASHGDIAARKPKPLPEFPGQYVATRVANGKRIIVRINPGESPDFDRAEVEYQQGAEQRRMAVLAIIERLRNS